MVYFETNQDFKEETRGQKYRNVLRQKAKYKEKV